METAVELELLRTGEIPTPHAYIFRPERGNAVSGIAAALNPFAATLASPCLTYIVRHPSAGTVLIDSGFHPDATRNRRQDFGWRMNLLFSRLKPADKPFAAQLAEHSVKAQQVEQVLMTHLHVDHTSGMRLLPRAEFVIAAREWEAATGAGAVNKGYVPHHLPPATRVRLVDFESACESYGPFAETVDWFGDGSVRLISTPGHARGHMSLLINDLERGEVLVVGDAAYTVESIRELKLPLLVDSGDETYLHSLEQLKAFIDQNPQVIAVPSHDPTAWKVLHSHPSTVGAAA